MLSSSIVDNMEVLVDESMLESPIVGKKVRIDEAIASLIASKSERVNVSRAVQKAD